MIIERLIFTINPTFLICQGIWSLYKKCKKTKEQESLQTQNDVQ